MTAPLTRLQPSPIDAATPAEWLETDGLSGYACGTASSTPARRYHGLLIAPLPGSARRYVFLAGFDEIVSSPAGEWSLSRRRHAGDAPDSWPEVLKAFEWLPWPRSRLAQGATRIHREVLMPKGQHRVLCRYSVPADAPRVTLALRPRLPAREADSLTFRNEVLRPTVEVEGDRIRCQPYPALPALTLQVDAPEGFEFCAEPDWDCGVEYATDLDRGYDGHEDLFSPGVLTFELAPGRDVLVSAVVDSGEPEESIDLRGLWRDETTRRRIDPPSDDLRSRCSLAAEDFFYRQPIAGRDRLGILAGFPWFGEWGRDTFLSLPGLTLARGQFDRCAEVLRGVIPFVADGLVPNIFGAGVADSHYGSVDAALWFARSVLLYQRAGGDLSLVQSELYPVLVRIADAYAAGTAERIVALGIGADSTGMIHAGTADLNPTWMDAKPSSGAVTPRHGCPVEIAGLWYSLLCHLVELADLGSDHATRDRFATRAASVAEAFLDRFWLADEGYLADVWRPDELDTSLRPNMVLATALEFSPLTTDQRRQVLDRAREDLLTPVGLRTLSPRHPDYIPHYRGGTEGRDRAYHQGTVWPWLLGCYCETALRVDPACGPRLRPLFDALLEELDHGGENHIAEVFDGDEPHRPGGSFAQAWNTAEVLRALALIAGDMPLQVGQGR